MARKDSSRGKDFTPVVGAETDVARLGRGPKPGHEKTAVEDADLVNWDRISKSPAYLELIHKKIIFIVPTCIFFVVYYFALPVLVGFYPEIMTQPVIGKVNWAYLFALSQFFVAWILAALYVLVANRFDGRVADILKNQHGKGRRS